MPPRLLPASDDLLDTWGRRNRKHADRVCAHCGTTFRPLHATSRYCSRPCSWANNGGQNKKPETWWQSPKGYVNGRIWEGDKQRHVKAHRLVMERYLGRRLLPSEDVHHINGDKADNRVENLQVMDHAAHARLSNLDRAAIAKAEGRTS